MISECDNEKTPNIVEMKQQIVTIKLTETVFSVFGRLFVKRFALCYRTVVCLSCLTVLLDA